MAGTLSPTTPANVRAVWDATTNPTVRNVTDAINASGKFAPVSTATVQRWKAAGWTRKSDGNRKPIAEEVQAKVEAAAQVLGEKKTLDEFVDEVAKEFANATDVQLFDAAKRESLITIIAYQRRARELVESIASQPREFAGLQSALTGSFENVASGAKVLSGMADQMMKVIEHHDAPPAEDPFKEIMAALGKAADDAGA